MPRDPVGMGAAVAGELGRLEEPAPQEDLFAQSPIVGERADRLMPVARRGRPLGAIARTTQEWRDFMLSQYRSPLMMLGDLTIVDTLELARVLGCKPLEALQLQKSAAAELAPYLHRKQPIAVDGGEGKPIPSIHVYQVGADALGRLFPHQLGNTEGFEAEPVLIEGEVAAEKSQDVQAETSSD